MKKTPLKKVLFKIIIKVNLWGYSWMGDKITKNRWTIFTNDKYYDGKKWEGLEKALEYVTNDIEFVVPGFIIDGYMDIATWDNGESLFERTVKIPRCKLTERFFA